MFMFGRGLSGIKWMINLFFLFSPLLVQGEIKEIISDTAMWKEKEGIAIFSGHTKIVEDEFTLFSPEIKAILKEGEIKSLESKEGVRILKEKEEIKADTFLFHVEENKLYLGGNVEVEKEKLILKGESGVFDLNKNQLFLKGKISVIWKNAERRKSP